MENAFDIFQPIKDLLYLGNYNSAFEDSSNLEINEDDISQVIKTYFYMFLSCVEEGKKDDLNNLLYSLKEIENKQIKFYYNVFILYSLFLYKKEQFNEQRYNNLYNYLITEKPSALLFPGVYIISLILLERQEYQNFISLTDKYDQDIEILSLRFYLFYNLNKSDEMQRVLNTMKLKEPDSILFNLCSIIYKLYKENDFTSAITSLNELKKNNKLTIKMYNFIGISLMAKGMFEEASRILLHGKDFSEKNGVGRSDRVNILVNLICVYRNLGRGSDVNALEETLRNDDPLNPYFERLNSIEKAFEELKA